MKHQRHALATGLLLLLAAGLLGTSARGRAGAEEGAAAPLRIARATKHEGSQRYGRYWNFWVRVGARAETKAARFFPGYEANTPAVRRLVRDAGFEGRPAASERDVWEAVGKVWAWWRRSVRTDNAAYGSIRQGAGPWPSIAEYAAYYEANGKLVCAACFSKAHLFATLLGRFSFPRDRIAVATCHHTEAGAPPTASHVYVAVYVADRWFYLDPTAIPSQAFPAFAQRRSIGVPSMKSVDYAYPFKVQPLPGSSLDRVPLLAAD